MNLFAGTSTYYRQFRPGVPREVADILDRAAPTRPGGHRRLLDIGTGTGLVVEALLGRFDDIIAADNDAEMLATAESVLRPKLPGDSRLMLVESAAEDFVPPAGWTADLVTICRAFHWLDQATVLCLLDSQVAPDGVVAVFGDNSFWAAGSPWKDAVRDVIKSFLGEERRAGTGTFQHHDRPYSEIMEESPFDQVEEVRVPVHRTWTEEGILGYLYSTSFAAPHLFGDRLKEFESTVRTRLADFGDDAFPEDNEFLIRIGRRSRT
ncbi:methyltransferase domain-containing protein [Streptomyces sp. SID5473]|uniref:Methyltransferase domain-containing protein n=1 Tax=Streptomyces tsukubensis (strain DSM 42081 / NBRC 108919 / NRRL 18488 / 9993) TaxID=1114943 RepID=I2N1F9_STRT9|nr:methyltransferase domain-containing protein [Streptomyces sp. SID5473]AZK95024.1 SAM-dependent methyltransferase [Streptomyces tsukubensis]EIF90856.1 type 12 methyltransferase [Streptomyces tsukubensis NRRL18488]MYS63153.1 methyltransferase domain-containing protein [Streptomyces sp. SID5473]QKM68910.1 methyltransferase domain-containing protein [Streptomyces tsukubensis NRRL18488]TAI43716.1 methyltransferase domain-containing protein [Streptomyces tsukubensis]